VPSIIVHGGAGKFDPGEKHDQGLRSAAAAGWEILSSGGSALDAVEAAVVFREDDPVFNAGYGASLNLAGEVECDASVMLSDLSAGAVAALKAAANPIRAARLVMERTDHVLLAGAGADEFARKLGLPSRDLRTDHRIAIYENTRAKLRAGEEIRFLPRIGAIAAELELGTVGAAALGGNGLIAAATSTGGMTTKLPGRVGDSAIIGAGTYAAPVAGVSATGHGEPIMRYCLAKMIVDLAADVGIRESLASALEFATAKGFEVGLVGVEENGAVAHGFTTQAMCWVSIVDGEAESFIEERAGGSDAVCET
jgi:beta-aspartyl-peptidase (threonine type)